MRVLMQPHGQRERDQRIAGALFGGVALFFSWLWIMAKAHEYGARSILLVGVLPQVLLGMLLGACHRWLYVPIALGMFLLPIVDALRGGPYAECSYVVGWPLAVGGLVGRTGQTLRLRRDVA